MWTRKNKFQHLDKKIKKLSNEDLIKEIDSGTNKPRFSAEELIYLIEHRNVSTDVKHAAYSALIFVGQLNDLQRLKKHMDFTQNDTNGHSMFYLAALCDRIDVMRWLTTIEPFTQISAEERTRVILNLTSNHQLDVLQALAKPVSEGGFGWDLNVRGAYNTTPVWVALMAGHPELAQQMIATVEEDGLGLTLENRELRNLLNVPVVQDFEPEAGEAYHRKKPGRKHSTVSLVRWENGKPYLDTYTSHSQLGEGRHGTVSLFTENNDPLRKLAVKRIHADRMLQPLSGWHIFVSGENVGNELQFLQRAYPDDGPYKIKHYVVQNGKQYDCRMVMPFVAGEDFMKTALKTKSPAEMAQLILAIAKELQRIHDLGIVHSDARYINILIATKDTNDVTPSFNVHFIDFGYARNKGDQAPHFIDKIDQLAPELYNPSNSPVRAHPSQDVYAFCFAANIFVNEMKFRQELDKQFPSVIKFLENGICKNPDDRPELRNFISDAEQELLSCQPSSPRLAGMK